MDLDRNAWFVKLFFWSLGIVGAFRPDNWNFEAWRIEKNGTNLCFAVRVTFLYMPLILLGHAVLFVASIFILIVLPIQFFGVMSYAATVAFIATVVMVIWQFKKIADRKMESKYAQQAETQRKSLVEIPVVIVAIAPKGPGFFEVFWAYLVATKHKVCPSIKFINVRGA